MDIVQYLHGLVSSSMGISNEDTSADLLKQYYALSTARLIELDEGFDVSNTKNHNLTALWGMQASPLAQRLARSFHMDEAQTATLLKAITPPMMIEMANLAGGQVLVAFLAQNFHSSRTHLPAWSPQFIQNSLAQKIELLNQHHMTSETHHIDDESHTNPDSSVTPLIKTDEADSNNEDSDNPITSPNDEANHPHNGAHESISNSLADNKPIKPKIARPNPLFMGLGASLVALCVGGGAWYLLKDRPAKTAPTIAQDPNIAKPNVESLNPPRLSLTSGENGTLYACQAEVGNNELQTQLLDILQKNFGQIGCIMDIDDNFGTSLIGLERLESIMAMVKSEPFTSIEIVGNHIYVNTPKTDILPRLSNDIALLAPQFQVSPAPALDKNAVITASFEHATNAFNKLGNPPNDYDLSRAASLMIIDFNQTNNLPVNTHSILLLLAEKLKQNPNAKLIIATHTSGGDGTDRMANLTLSQSQAEAVKAFLVKNGVNEQQLIPKGVGDTLPVADNVTELGRFKNGRTEFLVFDEATMSALNVDMTQLVAPAPNNTPPMQTATVQVPVPVQTMQVPIQTAPMQTVPAQTMPIQGMPDGNYLPQPVQAQPVQPEPIVQAPTQPSGYIGSAPPPESTPSLPDDFIELSNATISAERNKGGERELR